MAVSDKVVVKNSQRVKSKTRLIVSVAALLVVIVIAGLVWKFSTNTVKVKLLSGSAVDGQVETLSDDELESVINDKAKATESIDAAYARALALSRQDKNDESLKAFEEIAAAKVPPYYIVADHALVYARLGRSNEAVKKMESAIVILNNSSIDSKVKQDETDRLNNVISGLKEEAN